LLWTVTQWRLRDKKSLLRPKSSGQRTGPRGVVLDAEAISFVDVTAVRMLDVLSEELDHAGQRLVIAHELGQVGDLLTGPGSTIILHLDPSIDDTIRAPSQNLPGDLHAGPGCLEARVLYCPSPPSRACRGSAARHRMRTRQAHLSTRPCRRSEWQPPDRRAVHVGAGSGRGHNRVRHLANRTAPGFGSAGVPAFSGSTEPSVRPTIRPACLGSPAHHLHGARRGCGRHRCAALVMDT